MTLGDVVREGKFCTECPKYKKCELECNELDTRQDGALLLIEE